MRLDENYTIERDTYNFILKYEGESYQKEIQGGMKTFTPKEENYYPNMLSALKSYMDKTSNINGAENVQQVIDKLEEIYSRIEKLLKDEKTLQK